MAGETRQKILDAAEKLLLLKELARVTTKEIARETGLSEGALYRHFDHKEEVFFAFMARYLPSTKCFRCIGQALVFRLKI